jgi:hypothetical protein
MNIPLICLTPLAILMKSEIDLIDHFRQHNLMFAMERSAKLYKVYTYTFALN